MKVKSILSQGTPRVTMLVVLATVALCCASPRPATYIVTTDSHLICCRTLRYATAEFARTEATGERGDGLVVRLAADTVVGTCGRDAELGIEIANASAEDLYIPFSNELSGDSLKIYPWRLIYEHDAPMRLARQIQFEDLLERVDARLRFYRLPSHRRIVVQGIIPQRWLCTPPMSILEGYLEAELDPKVYSDRTRDLRASQPLPDPSIYGTMALRYDVAYTRLDIWEHTPIAEQHWNAGHDSLLLHVSSHEEPSKLISDTQRVASSNVVTLTIR
jgi:hypothetical protein